MTGYFRKGLCTEDEIISLNPYPENNTTTDVFEAILKEPGITNKDLSLKLGVDKSTISWHVSKLTDENFICFEKSGRFKRYYPNTNPRISPDQLT
ncbi:winged helix-turn-helix transcriptional regulator [Methanolobus zinderi]|uniref:Winged helix-turn-helix transcriptional regulator n=1 Tax=Methanolobus zinderi TaxID=536044 RepID=A0A7D5EGY6_9EURY|nr:winged helix-turn-helix transcriptional regulator [Methanolobus zinderi]